MSDVKKRLEREKKRGKKGKGAYDYDELDAEKAHNALSGRFYAGK